MPRLLSDTLRRSMFARMTDVGLLPLLTATYIDPISQLLQTLRFARNALGVISRGNLYNAALFDLLEPSQDEKDNPRLKLSLSNIDLQVISLIRPVTTDISILAEIVLIPSPIVRNGSGQAILDTVEFSFNGKIRLMNYTLENIDFDLEIYHDISMEPASKRRFRPSDGFLTIRL